MKRLLATVTVLGAGMLLVPSGISLAQSPPTTTTTPSNSSTTTSPGACKTLFTQAEASALGIPLSQLQTELKQTKLSTLLKNQNITPKAFKQKMVAYLKSNSGNLKACHPPRAMGRNAQFFQGQIAQALGIQPGQFRSTVWASGFTAVLSSKNLTLQQLTQTVVQSLSSTSSSSSSSSGTTSSDLQSQVTTALQKIAQGPINRGPGIKRTVWTLRPGMGPKGRPPGMAPKNGPMPPKGAPRLHRASIAGMAYVFGMTTQNLKAALAQGQTFASLEASQNLTQAQVQSKLATYRQNMKTQLQMEHKVFKAAAQALSMTPQALSKAIMQQGLTSLLNAKGITQATLSTQLASAYEAKFNRGYTSMTQAQTIVNNYLNRILGSTSTTPPSTTPSTTP